jgi:hypothetical protein
MAKPITIPLMTWSVWKSIFPDAAQPTPYSEFIHAVHTRREIKALDEPRSRWSAIFRFALITFAFSGIWVFAVPLLPLLLPVYVAGLGAWCADQTANAIANERSRKRYELVSVLPIGSAGITWTITQVTLRKLELIARINSLLTNLGILGTLSIIGFVLVNAIEARAGAIAILLMIALYLDFVQSVLIGSYIGIVASIFDSDRLSVGTLSVLLYLLVQLATYALGIALLIMTTHHRTTTAFDYFYRATLIGLVVLPLLREALLHSLWYWLTYRLESTWQEMAQTVGMK